MELLNIYEFIDTFSYDIDKLYVDKFWNSLNMNDCIPVDYDMLRWMGYSQSRERENKRSYLELLNSNFSKGKDFEEGCGESTTNRGVTPAPIMVSSRTFKKSLMMIRTQRAREIRDYYLLIEEIFLDYTRYTQLIGSHNHQIEINQYKGRLDELETLKNIRIDDTPIKYDEYVYVLTTEKYYNLNLFKIGKTTSLKGRLVSYNTGVALSSDEYFYIYSIKTCDSRALEKQLHRLLSNFHSKKEWFRINPTDLLKMLMYVDSQQKQLLAFTNDLITNLSTEPLSIDEFATLANQFPLRPTVDCIEATSKEPVAPFTPEEPVASATPEEPVAPEYVCAGCGREYTVKKHYDNHLAKGCIKCDTCLTAFHTRNQLLAHCSKQVKCVKSDVPPPTALYTFRCSGCAKGYKTQYMLDNHNRDGCNRCDRCLAVFDTKRGLTRHRNIKSQCSQR